MQRASASLDALEEKVALLLREKALNSGLAEAVARHLVELSVGGGGRTQPAAQGQGWSTSALLTVKAMGGR